jgi:LDH2 family malate/lactate/ureidoglycolate dehydrogenase
MIYSEISTIRKLLEDYLLSLKFPKHYRKYIVDNVIEAELSGKSSHGVQTLLNLPSYIESGNIQVDSKPTIKVSNNSLHIDSTNVSGYVSMGVSVEKAVSLLDKESHSIVLVAIKDMSYSPGYIGAYARKAADNGYFFLGFSKSPGGVVPHGGVKGVFGTNPITFSVPYMGAPVIIDTALGKINLNTLFAAGENSALLPRNVAVDEVGNPTSDPVRALGGGILPIAKHKGSSLAFISEIIAGALIGSTINSFNPIDPKWGYFYLIGKTNFFLDDTKFKKNIAELMIKHKQSSLSDDNIFYPGQRAGVFRRDSLKSGKIKIDSYVLNTIKERIA